MENANELADLIVSDLPAPEKVDALVQMVLNRDSAIEQLRGEIEKHEREIKELWTSIRVWADKARDAEGRPVPDCERCSYKQDLERVRNIVVED